MNILYIIDTLIGIGGAERNLLQLTMGLKERQEHVQVVFCLKGGPLARTLSKQGIEVLTLQPKRIFSLAALKVVFKMVSLAKQRKIDVIMTYHESSDFFGIILSVFCRIPVISNRRDTGFGLKRRHILFYLLANTLFDAIVAVSNAVKDQICEKQRADPKKITVIYNGIDSSGFSLNTAHSHFKKDMGFDSGGPIIGCLAHLRPIKGHKYLIEATERVLEKSPNAQFLFIGGYDLPEAKNTYNGLVELAEKKGVLNSIKFAGAKDDIPLMLSLMDISVIPSLSEGFSNTVLESMAAGKPVIATDVGGNPEAVIDGETGILVPPADPKAMADAILKLLDYHELRREMGVRGRQRAEAEFALDNMLHKYENLLRHVYFKNNF